MSRVSAKIKIWHAPALGREHAEPACGLPIRVYDWHPCDMDHAGLDWSFLNVNCPDCRRICAEQIASTAENHNKHCPTHLMRRDVPEIACGAQGPDIYFSGPFSVTCPECVATLPPQWQEWRAEYLEFPTDVARTLAEMLWIAHPTPATYALCRAQAAAPEMRLGQLVVNVLGEGTRATAMIFHRTDEEAIARLRAFATQREEKTDD